MAQRNSYLISRAMKSFIIASVLTLAVGQLTVMIDGVIVSQFVNSDAFAAINLYLPVNLLIVSLTTFVAIGGVLIAVQAMGRRDRDAVDGILSTAFISLLVCGAVLVATFWLARDSIIDWLCRDPQLRDHFESYIEVMVSFALLPMINVFFNQCTSIDGHPQKVTRTVLVVFIVNILLDLLFVVVLNMGVAGSAWATVTAYAIGIGMLARYIFSKQCSFSLRPSIEKVKKYFGENIKQGTPLLFANLTLTFMYGIMNNIMLTHLGADGMFALGICHQLLAIATLIGNGFGSAFKGIGGYMLGEGDNTGLNILVRKTLCWMLVSITIVMLVLEIFPETIFLFFKADTPEKLSMTVFAIRLFVPLLLIKALLNNFVFLYQMLGRLIITPLLTFVFPLVVIPSMMVFAGVDGGMGVWYSFPVASAILLVLMWLIPEVARWKTKGERLVPVVLIPAAEDSKAVVYQESVAASKAGVSKSLEEKRNFLNTLGIDPSVVRSVQLCIEELTINIAQHGGKNMESHYIDVRIVYRDNTLVVSVKDDGRPFNPTLKEADREGLGLKLLAAHCSDMEYKYIFGQNVVYMKWPI